MDTVFFIASKLAWVFLSFGNMLAILVLLSYFLLWKNAGRRLKAFILFLALLILTAMFSPIGGWILHPLETRFKTNPELPLQVDGIIVLAGGENELASSRWNQIELNQGAERNLYFADLARKYPDAKLLFTGGSGQVFADSRMTGADVAKKLFNQLKLNTDKILFEDRSRNTYENAKLGRELAQPKPGENWILITSASHMPRAVGVFKKLGWDVLPFPVDHKTYPAMKYGLLTPRLAANIVKIETGVKEWLGLLAYYISGKTSEILPDIEEQ